MWYACPTSRSRIRAANAGPSLQRQSRVHVILPLVLLATALTTMGCQSPPASDDLTPARHRGVHASEDCEVCRLFELSERSVVRIEQQRGQGAGLVISSHGHILTSAHVVDGDDEIVIETSEGTIVRGLIVRADAESDLAIVRADANDVLWQPVEWNADHEARVGSPIYVIGHPLGLGWTITEGLISGRRAPGEISPVEVLQTDAAISPGNSGGPVFDRFGRPIALVQSKIVRPGAENISFLVPWSVVRQFIKHDELN